jgi:hypothetical protein
MKLGKKTTTKKQATIKRTKGEIKQTKKQKPKKSKKAKKRKKAKTKRKN